MSRHGKKAPGRGGLTPSEARADVCLIPDRSPEVQPDAAGGHQIHPKQIVLLRAEDALLKVVVVSAFRDRRVELVGQRENAQNLLPVAVDAVLGNDVIREGLAVGRILDDDQLSVLIKRLREIARSL